MNPGQQCSVKNFLMQVLEDVDIILAMLLTARILVSMCALHVNVFQARYSITRL